MGSNSQHKKARKRERWKGPIAGLTRCLTRTESPPCSSWARSDGGGVARVAVEGHCLPLSPGGKGNEKNINMKRSTSIVREDGFGGKEGVWGPHWNEERKN